MRAQAGSDSAFPTPRSALAGEAPSLVEAMLAAPRQVVHTSWVGECTDDAHPVLLGRVRVRWTDPGRGEPEERWLACLHGVTVRTGDRVLLQCPCNWPEPLVAGVVDGFALRPEAALLAGPTVVLRSDESLRVRTDRGEDVVEVLATENGPVVRLLGPDVDLALPGSLRISAGTIALRAERGAVDIRAADDVTVEAEMIHLNPTV